VATAIHWPRSARGALGRRAEPAGDRLRTALRHDRRPPAAHAGASTPSRLPGRGPRRARALLLRQPRGRVRAELRFAGYDGLVVQGRAERPVWLAIDGRKGSASPAGELWAGHDRDARGARTAGRCGSRVMDRSGGRARRALATVFAHAMPLARAAWARSWVARTSAVAVRGSSARCRWPIGRAGEIDTYIRGLQRGNVKVWGSTSWHGSKTKNSRASRAWGIAYGALTRERRQRQVHVPSALLLHAPRLGYYGRTTTSRSWPIASAIGTA